MVVQDDVRNSGRGTALSYSEGGGAEQKAVVVEDNLKEKITRLTATGELVATSILHPFAWMSDYGRRR